MVGLGQAAIGLHSQPGSVRQLADKPAWGSTRQKLQGRAWHLLDVHLTGIGLQIEHSIQELPVQILDLRGSASDSAWGQGSGPNVTVPRGLRYLRPNVASSCRAHPPSKPYQAWICTVKRCTAQCASCESSGDLSLLPHLPHDTPCLGSRVPMHRRGCSRRGPQTPRGLSPRFQKVA